MVSVIFIGTVECECDQFWLVVGVAMTFRRVCTYTLHVTNSLSHIFFVPVQQHGKKPVYRQVV